MSRWCVLDGSLHVARGADDDPNACCTSPPRPCRVCGGQLHYQPVYGGYINLCETCDSDEWTDGPVPAEYQDDRHGS